MPRANPQGQGQGQGQGWGHAVLRLGAGGAGSESAGGVGGVDTKSGEGMQEPQAGGVGQDRSQDLPWRSWHG